MALLKQNTVTIAIAILTIVLAGIALFTAVRLFQIRSQDTKTAGAWDCTKYTFSVDQVGTVSVVNMSSSAESQQSADIKINGTNVATLDVPALLPGQSSTLGTVEVPSTGFTWQIVGSSDCQNTGVHEDSSCAPLTFTISETASASATPSVTATPTGSPVATATALASPTITPTSTPPIGGNPTATPTATARPTGTATPASLTASPSPNATSLVTKTNESLPPAGVSLPTIIAIVSGILILAGVFLLAV